MKTIALTLLALGVAFGQTGAPATSNTPPKDKAKSAAPAKTKAAAQPKPSTDANAKPEPPVQSIPAGAKQIEPNLYQYTDSAGKTWNYRQTPFGISKWQETATPGGPSQTPQSQPPAARPKAEPVVVTDLGDSYKFEKNTPFGRSTWTRKKSDLTDQERSLVGDQQTSAPASNSKPEGTR